MKNHCVFSIIITLIFVLAMLPNGTVSAQAQATKPEITRGTLYVPGEIVVGFNSNLSKADMEAKASALAGSVGAMVVDQYVNMALLSADPSADVLALAQQLTGQAGVAYAQPNYISWIPEADPLAQVVQLSEVSHRGEDGSTITRSIEELQSMRTIIKGKVKSTYPSDEYHNWGNSSIEHDIIWVNKNFSPVVCVVDTGADNKHPDLKGRIINGYDFVNNDKIPNDDNGHGTHVSGTIAAKTNNKIGPAGISNGKVLAVKALNAQGWGTDYDISKAIRYCADNTSVKVINMSLGSSVGSQAEYEALDYAINNKGKLVVAAAGNESTSELAYPAGWAVASTPQPNLNPNLIYHGLLSVGASRMPTDWNDYDLWVDTNGDNVEDSNELYNTDDCATWFSNYGDWVEIVAPGESIYSTLPVSYPFWNNYYGGSASGYDSWNGTSMAAPHVAGAAARVWSVYSAKNNAWIHNQLLDLDHSYALTYAVDPNVPDPTLGYNQNIPSGPGAGDIYGPIDEDTIRAPFCWPDATAPFEAAQNMSTARFLSVAAAMDRTAFVVEVTDATTGLPLKGASVTVKHGVTGKTIISVKMTSTITRYVDLINIPAQEPEPPAKNKIYHPIFVNMQNYTVKPQIITGAYAYPGGYHWGKWLQVGVPPKKGTTVVANWYSGYDLDLFAFLPSGAPRGVVGSGKSGNLNDIGEGTLLDYPYTRWHRNGGGEDDVGVEAITMASYPGRSFPYYLHFLPGRYYDILIRDYNNGADLNAADPIIRVWRNGKISSSRAKPKTCDVGEDWWRITSIGTRWDNMWDVCGTGDTGTGGVWPYEENTTFLYTSNDP